VAANEAWLGDLGNRGIVSGWEVTVSGTFCALVTSGGSPRGAGVGKVGAAGELATAGKFWFAGALLAAVSKLGGAGGWVDSTPTRNCWAEIIEESDLMVFAQTTMARPNASIATPGLI